MEKLTAYFGFEARYIIYPFIALVLGGCSKFVIGRYLHRWARKTENRLDDLLINYLDRLIAPLVVIAVLYGLSYWLPVPEKAAAYLRKAVVLGAILALVWLTAKLTSSILAVTSETRSGWQKYLQPFRTLSNLFWILIAAALILKALNLNLTGAGIRLIRIVGIMAGAYIIIKIVSLAVAQMERLVEDNDPTLSEAEKRARTLGKIIKNAAAIMVVGVSVMMILSEFGMNIAPIITGVGFVGLAVGFGAQNLVRDVISGFFLILEDQIRVGDVARINGIGGTVESIRLRTTVLRDFEGIVHIFPNGEIKQVANLTKEFSYYVINLGIAYKENVDEVMGVLKQIGAELKADPAFAPAILAPLEIMGIDDFAASQIVIKMRIKTLPPQQWAVGRELRRRIKNTFDDKGIELPFSQMSIHFAETDKAIDFTLRSAAVKSGEKKE